MPPAIRLTSLSLGGERLDGKGIVELVRRSPLLEYLSLDVTLDKGMIDLGPVLAVARPKLTNLQILAGEEDPLKFDRELVFIELRLDFIRFSCLTHLHLYNSYCSPSLLCALSNLPKLQYLEFRHTPDYATIRQLLMGPTKIHSLKQLSTDIPKDRSGVSHLDEDYDLSEHYDEDTDTVRIGSGWLTSTSGYGNGVREILDAAKKAKVVMKGNWSEAYYAAGMHDEEMAWCGKVRSEQEYSFQYSHYLRQRSNDFESWEDREMAEQLWGEHIEEEADEQDGYGRVDEEESSDLEPTNETCSAGVYTADAFETGFT